MKTVIEKERINPYMKRKEVDMILDHTGAATPNKAVVQHTAAKELGSKPEKVEVRNIFSIGGEGKSKAKIFIWDEKDVAVLTAKEAGKKEAEKKEVPEKEAPKGVTTVKEEKEDAKAEKE